MGEQYSRRLLIGTLGAVVVGGCVEGTGNSTDEEEGNQTDEETMNSSDKTEESGTEQTLEEQIAELPEPNPLSDLLIGLILADDRASFAKSHDLTFRDGAVQVEIQLIEGSKPPESLLPDDRSEYGDTVIGYVDVDALLDLARHESVERIFRRFEPEPS